jgi:N-acetylneuraminic acid mutarotase
MTNNPNPGPVRKLVWEELPAGPHPRLDAGGLQIDHRLYCLGGYTSQEQVLSEVNVFDLARCQWVSAFGMPPGVPQSHFALACEAKRFVFIAGGQLGPRCSPAISDVFVWDLDEDAWRSVPALPEPRYAPTMQFFNGRLHLIGGSKPDRYTPVDDHLSLGVAGGRALDNHWRVETPVPRGGMHRSSAVVHDRLYVFGGQEGDFIAVPGDPQFSCDGRTVEHIYGDVYEWIDAERNWSRLPDMPVQSSHIEFSLAVRGDLVLVAGGSHYKDPETFSIELTDVIQVFDTRTQCWTTAGRLPFRVKTCLVASYGDWLYVSGGQRDYGVDDPRPGAIDSSTWRAKLFA